MTIKSIRNSESRENECSFKIMRILSVFMVTIIVLLWNHKSKGYFELIEELGCHNTEFRLSCGAFNANLAIFEATFSQNDTFLRPLHTSCGNPGHPPDEKSWKIYKLKDWENIFGSKTNPNGVIEVNFRHAINRRCSGVNYCSFVLSEDFELAPRIGPGSVYLRYACVDDLHITKACTANINVSVEGFVRSPGYPSYYIGESRCKWFLRADPSQRVKLTFLDVSLREIGPYEGKCLDSLLVSENGLNLFSACGDVWENTVIYSDGPALNVTFTTSSKTLFPKRGFLLHYKAMMFWVMTLKTKAGDIISDDGRKHSKFAKLPKGGKGKLVQKFILSGIVPQTITSQTLIVTAVGCPTLRKPQDGYLINRNETFAHFRCCVGFIFPDTMSRDKILKCYNENTWDSDVFDCVNVTKFLEEELILLPDEILKGNITAEIRAAMETTDSIKDIIIPSIVICILFIGNAIIVYFIYRKRKKHLHPEKIELQRIQSPEKAKLESE